MQDRYRTQTLLIVALAALFVCAGSIAAGLFLYNQLATGTSPAAGTPSGSQARSEQGLLIVAIVPDSPAARFLQRGDILLQAGERPLRTPRDLQLALDTQQPAGAFSVTLLRGTAILSLAIPLAPDDPGLGVEVIAPRQASFATAEPQTPTPSAPAGPAGTVPPRVLRTITDSPAASVGIEVGDVITAVDGHAILNMAELVATIQARQPGDAVTLTLRRGPDTISRTVTLGSAADDPTRPFLGVELTDTP